MSFLRTVLIILIAALFPYGAPLAQELRLGGDEPDVESKASMAEDAAQKFFRSCVETPIFQASEDTDMAFCACASSNMQKWQSSPPEDAAQALLFQGFRNEEPGKADLLTDIYGPCLYIPIYEQINEECLNNDRIRYHARSQNRLEVMCDCMASGVESYFETYARPFLKMKFAEGKDIDDPIRAIKLDMNFYEANRTVEKNCYQQYHYDR